MGAEATGSQSASLSCRQSEEGASVRMGLKEGSAMQPSG